MSVIEIKAANTKYAVSETIKKRFSPRAFADTPISEAETLTILEAASWAASAMNEQPWEYHFALKGTAGFEKICSGLLPGNQPWAKNAAVLVVAIAKTHFQANQNPNHWATHDLGMANATLLLQAATMDIYGHCMAGFDKEKITTSLHLNEQQMPVCVIALGHLGDVAHLEEPFKGRELTPRSRKSIEIFTKKVD